MKRFYLLTFIILAIMSGCNDTASRNKCMEIECGEWQACNQKNGECEAKIGRCDDDTDCVDPQICDDGHNCVDDTNPCRNQTCSGHGECVVENNVAKCECVVGYHSDGLQCIKDDDLCQVVVCDDWDICNPGTGQCGPREGRCNEQTDCSESQFCNSTHTCIQNPCNDKDCSGHGRCEVINEEAICICEDGYEGQFDNCYDIDECKEGISNCSVNATCENTEGSFICTCNEGFTGDGVTCNPADLCLDVVCEEWEKCDAMTGSCEFKEGRCDIQTDCLQSQICNSSHTCIENLCNVIDCSGNGRCEIINDVPVCNCNEGFISDGINCNDVNECVEGTVNCDVGYICQNTNGSYICADIDECGKGNTSCTSGYVCENTEGAYSCLDINECSTGTAQCPDGYWCQNTAGSYTCFNDIDECADGTVVCEEGYVCENIINSYNCVDVNECENGTDNCSENAICVNTTGGFTCTCNAGYEGDGITCVDVNECENGTDNCSENAICTNTNNGFTCVCNVGYEGNGVICEDINRDSNQSGTSAYDGGSSLVSDENGNIFALGNTEGNLDGNTNSGGNDIFITKFDNCKDKIWTKQIGSASSDYGTFMVMDEFENIYITGYTYGSLEGNSNLGIADVFLIKLDSNSNIVWIKQWGTNERDYGHSIAIDNSGNLYVTGYTFGNMDGNSNSGNFDIYLTKFDNNGNKLWTKQWGGSGGEGGSSVITDNNGNVFVTGETVSNFDGQSVLGGRDVFITKFDTDGTKLWTKLFGSSMDDISYSLKSDEFDNIIITGRTDGDFDGNISNGNVDVFLIKLENNGNILWSKQIGSDLIDVSYSLVFDEFSNILLAGYTQGNLYANNNGNYDAFLIKLDSNGDIIWGNQWGTSENDYAMAVTVAGNDIFVTGETGGALDMHNHVGGQDFFLTKFTISEDTCINECENGTDNCSENAICVNTTGGFTCTCNAGYEGDGIICVDVNECTTGTDNCSENAVCTNTNGSFTCVCNAGYEGNGITCDNVKHNSIQFGTSANDYAFNVATDNFGNIFVTGGIGDTSSNPGSIDIFLSKYDNCGNLIWTKQWGTTSREYGYSVAVDNSGNVFVTGYSYGSLDGNPNIGSSDVFLTKFDNDGNKLFTKQWGSSYGDEGVSVTVDNFGNIFVTGDTYGEIDGNTNIGGRDAFITKFDNDGNKLFTKQWGSVSHEFAYSISVDSIDNIYVTGNTLGGIDGNINSGNSDIYLTKFDNAGNKLWTKQWGTSSADSSNSVAIDDFENIFITGYTNGGLDGNINSGGTDSYLTKFDKNGNKFWTKQFGTTSSEEGYSIEIDNMGNVLIAGSTEGAFDGNIGIGSRDIYLAKFDSNGNILWSDQWGTPSYDESRSVVINSLGNIFVAGYTDGNLDGNVSSGGYDGFITKFTLGEDTCMTTEQTGSDQTDHGKEIAVDNEGNVYVCGYTTGSMDGNPSNGDWDAVLIKYDNNGVIQWIRQWGTPAGDQAHWVAVDVSGNIFVTGETSGNLDGNTNLGGSDIFLTKFDTNGNKLWTKHLGNNQSQAGYGIKTDLDGNVFVTGWTFGSIDGINAFGVQDIFLIKLDNDGNELWVKQWGSAGLDGPRGIAITQNQDILVAGLSYGSINGNPYYGNGDIILIKLDNDGNELWVKQFGTSGSDYGFSVTEDNNQDLFLAGWTNGTLSGNTASGAHDFALFKLDGNGEILWERQWGSSSLDWLNSVAVDSNGDVLVTGYAGESIDGNEYLGGGGDILLSKFDTEGNKLWTKQFGTTGDDVGQSMAFDNQGNLFITGYVNGPLNRQYWLGGGDIYLMKFPAP